jgi:hypothetical protein
MKDVGEKGMEIYLGSRHGPSWNVELLLVVVVNKS